MCRQRRHGVSEANDPPPQLRRKAAGCGDKMHVLLSRPASRLAAAGAGGVVRSDKGRRNCAAEPPSGCWSGANRSPAKAAAAVAGLRHSPSAAEQSRKANVTKQAFCYADRNRREKNHRKLYGRAAYGGTTTPPICVPCSEIFRSATKRLTEPQNRRKKHGTGFSF